MHYASHRFEVDVVLRCAHPYLGASVIVVCLHYTLSIEQVPKHLLCDARQPRADVLLRGSDAVIECRIALHPLVKKCILQPNNTRFHIPDCRKGNLCVEVRV